MKTYKVEIIEIKTGKVVSVIGTGMREERAEQRETTGISRINTDDFFVRMLEEK